MTNWQSYIYATSLEEALVSLTHSPHPSYLIAGGTDLLLEISQGRHSPARTLVDITQVPELNRLEVRENTLWIGAAVPLARLVAMRELEEYATALHEAVSLIGGPQVRNVATLGGNVAHALPAADGAIALLALNAKVWLARWNEAPNQRYEIQPRPLLACYAGPGKSALADHELITAFELSKQTHREGSAFRRVMRPQGVAIAIQNMAVWVRRDEDRIEEIRIAIGPAGPIPFRAGQAEKILQGKIPTERVLDEAVDAIVAEARFRTSPHRATAEYRQRLAGYLLKETFHAAWQRAAL